MQKNQILITFDDPSYEFTDDVAEYLARIMLEQLMEYHIVPDGNIKAAHMIFRFAHEQSTGQCKIR